MPNPVSASDARSPRDGSGEMFDAIAERYDLMNRLLSMGVDQGWRRKAVAAMNLGAGSRALDLATGTADLAVLIARTHPEAQVVGVDPSVKMLEVGKAKVARHGLSERIGLEVGSAEQLPFAADEFDAVSIAFGIRNVPDRPRALREMARVTKPGGRVVVLELSEPRSGILGPMARFHVHTVVPWLGALLSGSQEYRYLQRSIAAFPPAEAFARTMEEAGLALVSVSPLTFGVCHLYVAEPKAVP
jgi:demethylmenaquinone methyltransferase/2-methoxy-6-polyprenyl-1,4-benzoquinol methylase